jgi:hypothetical protein
MDGSGSTQLHSEPQNPDLKNVLLAKFKLLAKIQILQTVEYPTNFPT